MDYIESQDDTGSSTSEQNREDQLIREAKEVLYRRLRHAKRCFSSPDTVKGYLQLALSGQQREVFHCLFLDSQHRLICDHELFQGTVDSCSVYPREVVKAALRCNAASVIFAHNHPSGVAEPSQADRRITNRLIEALALIDVRVLDHFVVGEQDIQSLAERGWV